MPHLAQRRFQLGVALRHPPNGRIGSPIVAGSSNLCRSSSSVVSFDVKAGRPLPGRRTLPSSEPGSSRSLSPRPIVLRASPVAPDDAMIPPYPAVRASAAPNRPTGTLVKVTTNRLDDASAMPQHKRHRIVPESSPWAAHLRDPYRLGHCWVSP
jgi:hypothetical protein